MKIVKARNNSTLTLSIFKFQGSKSNEYLGEHWICPTEDSVGHVGFVVVDEDPGEIASREWITSMITAVRSSGESQADIDDYLNWYFMTLLESALYRFHINVRSEAYSEMLFYNELQAYVKHIIDSVSST